MSDTNRIFVCQQHEGGMNEGRKEWKKEGRSEVFLFKVRKTSPVPSFLPSLLPSPSFLPSCLPSFIHSSLMLQTDENSIFVTHWETKILFVSQRWFYRTFYNLFMAYLQWIRASGNVIRPNWLDITLHFTMAMLGLILIFFWVAW